MQLVDDDTIDFDNHDLIIEQDGELLEEEQEGEGAPGDDNSTASNEQKNHADDSSIWSFVPPTLNDEATLQDNVSRDELTIIPIDSTDSMFSHYDKTNESTGDAASEASIVLDMSDEPLPATIVEDVDLKEEEEEKKMPNFKAPPSVTQESIVDAIKLFQQRFVTTISSLQVPKTIKNIDYEKGFSAASKLKDWRIAFFVLWAVTCMFTLHYARLSMEQSQELVRLQQENESLQRTISELKLKAADKTPERKGWFSHGSNVVKEWASTITDINISDFYSPSDDEESTYLDTWPADAIDAVKNVSSTVAALLTEVVDDVSTGTKDAFETMSETFASVGANYSVQKVSKSVSTMSETFIDIWNSQKYAILLGAIYFKAYELFENN